MGSRTERVVQICMMLTLLPLVAFAQESREPPNTEAGPRGLACKDAAAALGRGTFALAVGQVTLRDGKACVTTGLEHPRCSFDVELTRVEPWGGGSRLIVIVNASHAGPGAWDSVFLYACRKGVLEQSHSRRYLYGARISKGAKSELVITSGEWRKDDPACCASRERREYFDWNDATGKVVLKRTEIRTPVKR